MTFKKILRTFATIARPILLPGVIYFNRFIRGLAKFSHKTQFYLQWAVKPNPEWFDHYLDQYYKWHTSRNPLGWERGIFNLLALKPESTVLELCCGDGFNAHHFYSIRVKNILSIDFDPKAIAHAKQNFQADNVVYQCHDIRQGLPKGPFTNVIWDAAIEHFTIDEITRILNEVKQRIGKTGILSGYTIVERDDGASHDDHEYEFKSKEDLQLLLKSFFKHVVVLETVFPDRTNLYFYTSESPISFLDDFQLPVKKITSQQQEEAMIV
ncbi:class I SAM-dependent methyltransferase [Candidatus Berkiella cookevillensis]|uniref:Class I SAM-dependent methyltransferase n=1 Tax=Candidatus Berkiella cookevillensis TaxID=437022 RepID=A0A0Q9YGM6_9GAMM|nr:class I SAM-dependent methyltransferase [Candidatus Berkiella cookevillensis]MCS5707705.1 class I SAM-dependent methyltransferase [Candidatus Berkiella cookevillensis]